MQYMPKVMITFREGGENGGPYVSHKRILESDLKYKYLFEPLVVPGCRLGILNIKVIKKLIKDIKEFNPDIVHLSGLQLEGFHVAIACKLCGIKNTVLAIHGSTNEALEFPKYKKSILNILEKITLKITNTCYGVSKYVGSWEILSKYSNNYFGYIYNLPHNENQCIKEVDSIRYELGIDKDTIVITSTGRITKEKGYHILCETIKKLETNRKIVFIIAGKGEYLEDMKKELLQENVPYEVKFLGYRSDIDRILEGSDIFIISTLHETLCNSLVEAGKQGLALIASNVGGIPEIIKNDYNGYLTEVNDVESNIKSLKKLIEDDEKRKKFGYNSKKKIESEFSEEIILNKIDNLYRSFFYD